MYMYRLRNSSGLYLTPSAVDTYIYRSAIIVQYKQFHVPVPVISFADVASAMRVAVLLLAVLAVDGATEYTMDTFDAAREGKNAFVKFLAPW